MRKMYSLVTIISTVCLILATVGWAQEIKVGAVINLTGPISSWGKFHAKGHRDYFQYVNEVKGGVAGKKIQLTLVDHAYKIQDGVKFVKKFCEEKVDMIATWDTGLGIQAKPIIQEYKIPTINYSTGQDILKPPIEYMYLPFGSYVLDSYAVMEYIRAIHKGKDAPKVGLLTLNNAYGKSVHGPSKEYAAKNNINIVTVEEFPAATVDLTTEMLRLKQKGAEYIFTQILGSNMISALKAADRNNYNPLFIGTWTTTDPDFFQMGQGLIRKRLLMQFMGCIPGDKVWGMKLMEDLWKRYKTVDKYDTSYWEGVVVAMIMERAMQRASGLYGKITSETINKAMETFQNEDFGGLVPYVSYTKANHEGSFMGRIVQIHEDSTYTPMSNFFIPGKGEIKVLRTSGN